MTTTAIVWLRRDLRLSDQPALHHAAAHHDRVLPVFIFAPEEDGDWPPGGASRWWLHHSLTALSAGLQKLGSPLLIRQGASLATLQALVADTGASAVYWNRLYEPAAIARDARIKEALKAQGLTVQSFNGALLFEPWQLQTGSGTPYRVYSPFFRAQEARFGELRALLPAPKKLQGAAKAPKSESIASLGLLPSIPWDIGFAAHWQPGEAGAQARLERFAEKPIATYKDLRDQPALDGAVSGLSAHLHWGEISPNQVFVRAEQAQGELTSAGAHGNIHHFVKELAWREFSHHLLYHYPRTPAEPMYDKFARFPWREPADYASDLKAWQRGETGVPIVDAGMRQLWQTGIMHNRVRMIVASYLTKNLLIPWQEGAAWFWDTLVDASLPQNTLGWQWAAGCGADAAPYFRIFNPVLQGEKFDAEGAYIRRFVPELAKMPAKFIHKPWEAPSELRRACGLSLDHFYARPIVDLKASRDRALGAYDKIKGSSAE